MKTKYFLSIIFLPLCLSACESFRIIEATNSSKTDIVIGETIENTEGLIWMKLDTIHPGNRKILTTSTQLSFGWFKTKESVFLSEKKKIVIYMPINTILLESDRDLFNLIESEYNRNPKVITTNFRTYNVIFE